MVDLLILAMLSRPRTILGKEYKVAWDCELNKARIIYTQSGEDAWEYMSQIFDSELEAHAHLNLMATLNWKPDNLWRSL